MGCFGGGEQELQTPKEGGLEKEVLGSGWAMFKPILDAMGYEVVTTPGVGKKGKPTFSIQKSELTPEEQARRIKEMTK